MHVFGFIILFKNTPHVVIDQKEKIIPIHIIESIWIKNLYNNISPVNNMISYWYQSLKNAYRECNIYFE